jgi:hypothetical protein
MRAPRLIAEAAPRSTAVAMLIGAICVCAQAQRPERRQDLFLPGLGVHLRGGWLLLFRDSCRYAVPMSWRPRPDNTQAFAPDGSSLSLWALHVGNWSAHKSRLKGVFGPTSRVREETDARLWIEVRSPSGLEDYIAVTDGPMTCAVLLEIRSSTPNPADTIAAIADSLGFVPLGWTPDAK